MLIFEDVMFPPWNHLFKQCEVGTEACFTFSVHELIPSSVNLDLPPEAPLPANNLPQCSDGILDLNMECAGDYQETRRGRPR